MKPFKIRVPTTAANDLSSVLKWKERRWCGHGHEILGYDSEPEALAALLVAKISTPPEEGECEAVRGLAVRYLRT